MLSKFYRNPRALVLIIALLVVSGLAAIKTLPRSEDPRISNRNAVVLTQFPGASAERVEALISEKIENKLREVPEVKFITSRSRSGISAVNIELKDATQGDEIDAIWTRVRTKLDEIVPSLPSGASDPDLDRDRGYAYTIITAITWQGDGEPDQIVLKRYAEELESRLRNVPGTDLVRLYGQQQEEINVKLDPANSVLLGLDASTVSRIIATSDAKVAAGTIDNPHSKMAIEVSGALDSVERIRNIPLQTDANGAALRLGDIATIERTVKSPAKQVVLIEQKRAVMVAVRMLPGLRGDLWHNDIVEKVTQFETILPSQLAVEYLFEQERFTDARLSDLVGNIVTGFTLIVVVLLITLGWRSALIVASALPLTLLFALSVMKFTGLPIHQMTVTGLIVALGIMVDNAIVMADTVMRNLKKGIKPTPAILSAVRHLWLPLLGSTLTTIITFMPIVLMPGPAGEFIGGIAFTVTFSLIGSYIISHTIVALLAGRYLKNASGEKWHQVGVSFPRVSNFFQGTVKTAVSMPWMAIAVVIIIPILGFWSASKLTEQFFPPSDRDMLNIEVYLPMSASIEQTEALTVHIDTALNRYENIKSAHWVIGSNTPSFYYNLPERKDGNQNFAQAMITTVDFQAANELASTLQTALDDEFPQAQIIVRRLEQGPPAFSPVQLRLLGHDLEELKRLGLQLKLIALQTQDVTHVRTTLNESVPKIWLDIDENASQQTGLALTSVAEQIRAASNGQTQGSILEGTQQLMVRVEMAGVRQLAPSALADYPLQTGIKDRTTGIPLETLGKINIQPAQGVITRRDGQRSNVAEIYIRDGVLPATVLNAFKDRLAASDFSLPNGYQLQIGGEDENRDKAVGNLMSSVGMLLVLLIVTVVMSFNSFRLSSIVFFVSFQAAGLGLLSLSLSGYPMGFTAIIGLMGLIGLAINAAIVILSELKQDPLAMAGNEEAITQGVVNCSRHITSTTITTIVGFIPLIIAGGGFWPPFAIVVAGGTLLTTLLSFYCVPAAFKLLYCRTHQQDESIQLSPAGAN